MQQQQLGTELRTDTQGEVSDHTRQSTRGLFLEFQVSDLPNIHSLAASMQLYELIHIHPAQKSHEQDVFKRYLSMYLFRP